MNAVKNLLNAFNKPAGVLLAVIIVVSCVIAVLSYRLATQGPAHIATTTQVVHRSTPTPTPTPTTPATATPVPTPTPVILPPQDAASVLGVEGNTDIDYGGIPWVRLAHPSCGHGNLSGQTLHDTLQTYHQKNVRVLMTICQDNKNLFNTDVFNDVARAYPDAVQCGNEEMKQDASVAFLYTPPDQFAKFYDLCAGAVHAVNPNTPAILGSLDPHVAGPDYGLMVDQANYLDQMQDAMNSTVHPGGNWNWHDQILGVIDSWHNGYLGSNNIAGVLDFWAQQFGIGRNSGELGKHLWIVEATGCFKGCGVNANSPAQVAISHILTLITDVQTAMQARVPIFFFSGKDFWDAGLIWPIGILDVNGQSKPIRQDLSMGARTLTMSCPDGSNPSVADQEQLLAKLYAHCSLPGNYVSILAG